MKKQNGSIGDQLKNIGSEVKFVRAKMFELPPLNEIGNDGLDHINIWESGATNLGRALSSFTAMPFKHDVYGKFASMEGFWHYIRSATKDDDLRHLSGYNARSFGRSLKNDNVPDMYYIVADANWQKIKTYPALIEEIRNLHMPFDSYYLEGNKAKHQNVMVRARSLHSKWLVPAFHEIHEAIHQDREPDFSFLKDENKSQFYHPLVKKERSEGGFNSHLLDMYKEKPVHTKPKKAAALEASSKVQVKVELDQYDPDSTKTIGAAILDTEKELDMACPYPESTAAPTDVLVNKSNIVVGTEGITSTDLCSVTIDINSQHDLTGNEIGLGDLASIDKLSNQNKDHCVN